MRRCALAVVLSLAGLWPLEAAAAGPIAKGPWVQRVGTTSAVVRVEVDPPAAVTVELGISGAGGPDGGGKKFASTEVKSLHAVTLTDLEPATRYTYTVRANGAERFAALTTAPREDSGAPFRFLIYGDNRTDDASHAAIVRAMMPVASDFLVNTGDMVTEGASARDWQSFFDIEAPLLRERCMFSCIGNHELIDGAGIEFVRYFGLSDVPLVKDGKERPLSPDMLSGTMRWSNARFFFLNGMVQYRAGSTREWLDKALTDSDSEKGVVWRIVVVHHGPWSSGPHGENQLLHEAGIVDMFRRHGVDLVIAGHDHIYERGFAEGLPYIVSGGGGAPTYRVKPKASTRKHESVRHFVEASASQAAIQFVATRGDGTTIERCALRKQERAWDCDGPVAEAKPAPASVTAPAGPVAPAASSKCGCDVPGVGAPGGIAGAAAIAALVAARLRRRR